MASPSGAGVALTILRFCLSTLPFLAVLVYLLYMAVLRGNVDEDDAPNDDPFSLMDSMIVFLSFHVFWTLFVVYILVFVPKRRYLLDRYLRDGERTIGDVIVVDEPPKKFGLHFLSFRQYGYAIYSHPTQVDPPMVVRKKVRVYQPFTREKLTIITLPDRPKSGQAKIDIEIDLSQMRTERDTTICYISAVAIFWVLFSLAGAAFCTYQMGAINDGFLVGNENVNVARRTLLIVAGINPFFAFVVNSIRFLMYHNWMVHRGKAIEDEGEARKMKPKRNWFLYNNDDTTSLDGDGGEAQIPYSVMGEDRSFAGTLPSHSSARKSHLTVSSTEDSGSALRILPWTST